MALARTALLGQITSGNFGTGNFTSTAFTPANSSLLVVAAAYVENNGTTTDPTTALTISGGSLTWTQQQTAVAAPTAFPTLVKIWTAPVTAGSSMSVTLSASGRTAGMYGVSVACYTGYNTGTPVGGTATGSQASGFAGPPTPASITLSAAPASADEVFGFVFADKNTTGTTQGSAFTEIDDLNNVNWGSLESEVRTGSTSTTVDWVDLRPAGGSLFNFAAVAIVVQAAAGATATFPPSAGTRRRLTAAPRQPRARTATPVRAQVNPPFPFTSVKQPREPRGMLGRRPRNVAPVPAQVIVAAPALPPSPLRTRLRGLRAFRGHAATPVPAQASAVAPAYPVKPVRPGTRSLRLFRGHAVQPVQTQTAVIAPPYPSQSVRTRLRGLRLFRPHATSPVPSQVVVTPPGLVPAAVRPRLKGVRLFRGRPAASPSPPQAAAAAPIYPPRGVRPPLRGLKLFRGHATTPIPPQVVIAPPAMAPPARRIRARMFAARRGRAELPLPQSAPPPVVAAGDRPPIRTASRVRALVTTVRERLLRTDTRGD